MTSLPRLLLVLAAGLLLSGAARPARGQALVGPDASWSWLRGTAEPPADWASPAFDDTSWSTGLAGFGYGDGDDRTDLPDMQGSYASVYLRARFEVLDPA